MNTFKLALRGLTRNRRRSLVTLLAIALGFAAIALFAGYTHNVFSGLAQQSIHGELLGHLTLSKRGMRMEGKLDPERYMLTAGEVDQITKLLVAEPHVKMVAPQLGFAYQPLRVPRRADDDVVGREGARAPQPLDPDAPGRVQAD